MNNKFLVLAGASAFAFAMLAKDPVIMTVNGEDVLKSEFEYLYHKNSQQQLSPQPLDEYVEMFKLYKLKVADAKAAGIDTLASFRKEMAQYKRELAQPYLTDSLFLNNLIEEAARRGAEEVEVSHIMLAKTRSDKENQMLRNRLDSIRKEILNGADFAEMAKNYSADRGSSSRGGSLGFITANRYPYEFEVAAYRLPSGEVSEIVESPVGYHLLKTGSRRPSKGKVHASHIMKMAQKNATPEERAAAKSAIDSIYNIVKANPSLFAEIAKKESDDRGSAVKGGELPWFGPGEMVPEFETAAFALADGEISSPIETQFGWHIILKDGHKGAPSADELRTELLKRFNSPQDGRWEVIKRHNTERLAAKHKARINQDAVALITSAASQGIDSLFFAKFLETPQGDMTLIETSTRKVPVKDYLSKFSKYRTSDPEEAVRTIEKGVDSFFSDELNKEEEDWLYANNSDYRNLLNEYHDGSLLYEVSVQKVWDKAAKDKAGLDNFFASHKDNYSWAVPHVKGILVQAQNDSVAAAVKERMDTLPSDSIVMKIRKEFKGKATAERVLVEKGANAMVDNILFGGPAVTPTNNYSVYFLYSPRVLNSPEEAADVKGAVTGDYQNELEARWAEELKAKYPVKINHKELKKVK